MVRILLIMFLLIGCSTEKPRICYVNEPHEVGCVMVNFSSHTVCMMQNCSGL